VRSNTSTVPVFALFNTCTYISINHCLNPDTVWFQECIATEIKVQVRGRGTS